MDLQPFIDAYGFVAGDEVLRFTALTIGEAVDKHGTGSDFIGQATSDAFVMITYSDRATLIVEEIQAQFSDAIGSHYNFLDSERGGIELPDGSVAPLMRLAAGIVTDEDGPFSDIREITEAAVLARRADPSV
jgi:GGDEF domain-containing protein